MPTPEVRAQSPEAAAAPSGVRPRLRELVPALAGIAVAVLVFVLITEVPDDTHQTQFSPRWWPEGLAFVLLGLSIAHGVVSAIRPPTQAEDDGPGELTRSGVLRLLSMLAVIAGYGVLWSFIDFRVSTTILFIALSYLGGGRGWKALIAFPVVATMTLYLLFGVLLRVPL